MSSCSEHLVRQQLRATKYTDTRPKMTCGQMIEIQRQQAASAVYEQFLPATACVSTLNAPSTRTESVRTIARGHQVKDASAYVTYASASSTSAMRNPVNDKQFARQIMPGVSQIRNENCLGPTLVPTNGVMPATFVNQLREVNDTILLSTLISTTDPNYRKEERIAAARQAIANCCSACGKVNLASTCSKCRGVNTGEINPDGSPKWKNAAV
jgi:hypothetical protein